MRRRIKRVSGASAFVRESMEYRPPVLLPGLHPWLLLKTPNYWWLELVRRERALGREMTEGELAECRKELEVARQQRKEQRACERVQSTP